jgi:hypothetical protein
MRTQKAGISILTISAAVLFLACVFINKPTHAEVSVKDRDYMMCTFPSNNANDAIYIADTRNGMFGVFVWDNTTRSLQPIAVRPLADAFGGKQ